MSNKPKSKNKSKNKQSKTQPLPGESAWPKRLAWAGGITLVVGLVAIVALSQPELRGVPDGTATEVVGDPVHVEGEVYADGEVPAGGQHSPIWQNCGFYGSEVATENVLHSLEHGAVWISYSENVPDDEVQSLRRFVSRNEKVVVSMVAGQGASIIATAWARQLELDDTADSRLEQFVNEFTGASSSPEPGGRCNSGVGQPQF